MSSQESQSPSNDGSPQVAMTPPLVVNTVPELQQQSSTTSNAEPSAVVNDTQLPASATAVTSNDFGSAIVTLALSINISANGGVYATSRCSSPVRVPSSQHSAGTESSAPQSLKLSLGEAVANQRANAVSGFSSLPSSHPQTPQATPAVDNYLMDLQHKLASLSMTNTNNMQQQSVQQQPLPDSQLASPSSSTKESSPQASVEAVSVVTDQVDQATDPKPRKVLPSTIDIHDLETELAKLHSQGGHSLLKVKESSGQVQQISSPPELADSEHVEPSQLPVKPASIAVSSTSEQKISQTESTSTTATSPGTLIASTTAPPAGRRVSRFSVCLVEERASPTAVADDNDPELKELLGKQEQERKALAKKHEEELALFHLRRKQQQQQQRLQQSQQQKREETLPRTPSPPGARSNNTSATESTDQQNFCSRGIPSPTSNQSTTGSNTSGGSPVNSLVNSATPGSSPGTPTRQTTKTFTDDLLRLVQDLGSKSGAEKNKIRGNGEEAVRAPTLNQLRAGVNGSIVQANQQQSSSTAPQSQCQQQNSHSLTQTAGIFPSSPTNDTTMPPFGQGK